MTLAHGTALSGLIPLWFRTPGSRGYPTVGEYSMAVPWERRRPAQCCILFVSMTSRERQRLAGSSFCHTRGQAASSCDGGRSRHRLDLTYILVWEKSLPAGRRRSQGKKCSALGVPPNAPGSATVGQPLTPRAIPFRLFEAEVLLVVTIICRLQYISALYKRFEIRADLSRSALSLALQGKKPYKLLL